MSRRKIAVWAALLVAVVLNGFILWNRSRHTHAPLAGKEKSQVARILEWESPSVVALNESLSDVEAVIANYPRDRCPDFDDISPVSFDQLAPAEQDDLFSAIATLLQCYEKSSPTALLSYNEGRNEQFNAVIMDMLKEEKVSEGFVTRDELKTMSDKDVFVKAWDWSKCNSHWEAVVEETGYVCLWRSRDRNEVVTRPLGKADNKVFHNVVSYAHFFKPDYSLEDACQQSEGVLVADFMVVMQHDEILNMERSPYFFRFWYSEHDRLWHPLHLKHVRTIIRHESPRSHFLF